MIQSPPSSPRPRYKTVAYADRSSETEVPIELARPKQVRPPVSLPAEDSYAEGVPSATDDGPGRLSELLIEDRATKARRRTVAWCATVLAVAAFSFVTGVRLHDARFVRAAASSLSSVAASARASLPHLR